MKLSLSVRVAESAKRKDVADLPIEALAPLAKAAGFQALSMRASVVSVTSPPARVQAVKQVLAREGLTVSMVTATSRWPPTTPRPPTPSAISALISISPKHSIAGWSAS